MRLDELARHVAVVEAARGIGDHERYRLADLREMGELGQPVPGQAHHRDRSGAQQPEQGNGELG